jgi:hypothetical protein
VKWRTYNFVANTPPGGTTLLPKTCYLKAIDIIVTGTPGGWAILLRNRETPTPITIHATGFLSAFYETRLQFDELKLAENGVQLIASGTVGTGVLDLRIGYRPPENI